MSLYQRPGSPYWQYDFTVNGQRFRGSTGEKGKREARQIEDEIRHSARQRKVSKGAWTMQMLCEAYWDGHAQERRSEKTIFNQLVALRRHIGKDRKLLSITDETLLTYRAKRRGEGLQPHSVNREITILRAAMRYAAKLHKVAVPELHWEDLKTEEPPHRVRYLTQEEWAALYEAAHRSIRPILLCAISTGLRKGNILTLDWSQVSLSARRIVVTVKGNKRHEARVVPQLRAALSAMPDKTGKVFDTTNFEKRWRQAIKDAGIADFRFHDLRHTFASWARQAGADIADVKDALGHSDISMTMRYAHIKPDAQDTAFDRVSRALMAQSTSHRLQKREN